jgi:phosphatidylinositol kinase/protein kinase (PI-3  family)
MGSGSFIFSKVYSYIVLCRCLPKVRTGCEDLRQDERVMQVIGLVNTLLSYNKESSKRRLHLQRYAVIPLAPDVGLIGWMAGTDPLQDLVKEYRDDRKIAFDIERRLILQVSYSFLKLVMVNLIIWKSSRTNHCTTKTIRYLFRGKWRYLYLP